MGKHKRDTPLYVLIAPAALWTAVFTCLMLLSPSGEGVLGWGVTAALALVNIAGLAFMALVIAGGDSTKPHRARPKHRRK